MDSVVSFKERVPKDKHDSRRDDFSLSELKTELEITKRRYQYLQSERDQLKEENEELSNRLEATQDLVRNYKEQLVKTVLCFNWFRAS